MSKIDRPDTELRPGKDALVQPVANTFLIGLGPVGETIMVVKHPNGYWEPIGGKGKENETPEDNALGEAKEEIANFPTNITSASFVPLRRWLIPRTGKITLDVSRFVALSPFLSEDPVLSRDADCTEIGYINAHDHLTIEDHTHEMKMRSQVRTDVLTLLGTERAVGTTLAACPGSEVVVKILYLNASGKAVYLEKHRSSGPNNPLYALPVQKHLAFHHLHSTLATAASDFLGKSVSNEELKQRKILLAQAASLAGIKPTWVIFYLVFNPEIAATYSTMPAHGAWIDIDASPSLIEKVVVTKYRDEVKTALREVHIARRVERAGSALALLQPLVQSTIPPLSVVTDMATFKKK